MSTLSSVSVYANLLEQVENNKSGKRPSPKKYNTIPDMITFRLPEIKKLPAAAKAEIIDLGNKILTGHAYTMFEIYELEGENGQPPAWAEGKDEPEQIQKFQQAIKKIEQTGVREIKKIIANYKTNESADIYAEFDILSEEYGIDAAFDILAESNPNLVDNFKKQKLIETNLAEAICDAHNLIRAGGRRLQVFTQLYESYDSVIATDVVNVVFNNTFLNEASVNLSKSATAAAKSLAKQYTQVATVVDQNYEVNKHNFT